MPSSEIEPGARSDSAEVATDNRSDESRPLIGARWAKPILTANRLWTRFEIALACLVLSLEVLSMSLWVLLKGFSSPSDALAAVVFRALLAASVLGTIAYTSLWKQDPAVRQALTVTAVFLGVVTAKAWSGLGVDYASNVLNWYQQASFLTLLGGLRGVGTRLTMLLALLGGSLATGRGKHVVIDVLTRFVSYRVRVIMTLISWTVSAMVCVVAAWGFFDHIAIENFGARTEDSARLKLHRVAEQLGEDAFIARKQIALDFKSAPHVLLKNETYTEWLSANEWNQWVESAGFVERYGKQATEGLKVPEGSTRAPLVVIPGRGEPRGELINAAYLVFPIGLLVIAMRFVVRGLLAVAGHVSFEPDETDEWSEHSHATET